MATDSSPAIKQLPEKQELLEQKEHDGRDVSNEKLDVIDKSLESEKSPLQLEPEAEEPRDRYWLVWLILALNGVATLMPWNMFINAKEYFVQKLNVTTLDGVSGEPYADYYLNWLGIIAQIPNLLLSAVNLFYQQKGKSHLTRRMVLAIMTMVVCFLATVVLAMVNTSQWPVAFFWVTMVLVVILNMATGIYQNNVYGLAAFLPMKYTNAVVIGSNTSGTLVAILAIITTLLTPDLRQMAIYYFVAAIFVLLVAFDLFFVLPLLKFYRHYKLRSKKPSEGADGQLKRPPYLFVFKQCWKHHLSVWLVFFVTLACFPAINAGIEPAKDFSVQNPMYMLVFCFFFFNFFALIGNICASFFQKPGPRWVWIPVMARLLFIPFFMMCNFSPTQRSFNVLIPWDVANIIAMIVFAWSSGYFSSLCMMYAPGNVEPEHMGTAGMMAAFFLIFGIFCGVLFSMGLVAIIKA